LMVVAIPFRVVQRREVVGRAAARRALRLSCRGYARAEFGSERVSSPRRDRFLGCGAQKLL